MKKIISVLACIVVFKTALTQVREKAMIVTKSLDTLHGKVRYNFPGISNIFWFWENGKKGRYKVKGNDINEVIIKNVGTYEYTRLPEVKETAFQDSANWQYGVWKMMRMVYRGDPFWLYVYEGGNYPVYCIFDLKTTSMTRVQYKEIWEEGYFYEIEPRYSGQMKDLAVREGVTLPEAITRFCYKYDNSIIQWVRILNKDTIGMKRTDHKPLKAQWVIGIQAGKVQAVSTKKMFHSTYEPIKTSGYSIGITSGFEHKLRRNASLFLGFGLNYSNFDESSTRYNKPMFVVLQQVSFRPTVGIRTRWPDYDSFDGYITLSAQSDYSFLQRSMAFDGHVDHEPVAFQPLAVRAELSYCVKIRKKWEVVLYQGLEFLSQGRQSDKVNHRILSTSIGTNFRL